MLSATNIFIKYGDRTLFDRVNLVIGEKDKLGLVGRNGAGKSTFLKILSGEIRPDDGKVSIPAERTMGFLKQELELMLGKTVLEEALSAFEEVKELEKRIEEINEDLGNRTDYESAAYAALLEELSTLNDRLVMLDGGSAEAKAEKVLKGLGFKTKDLQRLTDEFSGGWQMRIELAKLLLRQPDYLMLDEPTNHLDIESIIWLEQFLKTYPGAIIIISHDQQFLDNVTNRTVEIELGKLFDYKAPYKKFMELRQERRAKQLAAFTNQQKVIAQRERTINRFMAKATKTKMAQSMKKQLDKMERIEIEQEGGGAMNIKFPPAPRSGQVVVEGKKVVKQYEDLLVLNQIDIKVDRGDRVAFVGQNGQGKTTLAKILINELSATKGDIDLGHNVQIGYYAQNQSDALQPNQTLLETMEAASPPEMRTKLRSILGAFLFSGEDVDKKVSVLSGGERARLAMACLLLRPINLLVLDEPTNHLDIISKEVLKQALLDFDGTLLVVSHDREFLTGLTTRTIEFRDKQLFNYIGDVNAFLEKRALDNMRAVEMSTATNAKSSADSNPNNLSFEERKQLMRAIKKAERQIEKLEKDIAKMEQQMAAPDFYEKPEAQKLLQTYEQKKQQLEEAFEQWEVAQEELGE